MLLNRTISILLLCFLSCVCLVHAQGCAEPTDENIRSAIDFSLTVQTKNQTDVFLMNASIVCLASSGARDRYNFVSVVATYTTDTSADPVTAQFEFRCGTGASPLWLASEKGVLGVDPALNMKLLSADDPVLTAELRTDCSTCISLTNPFADRHSSLTPDNVTHCVACPDHEDCQKPSLCVLELPVGTEPVVECSSCNALLENGTCTTECPSGETYFINTSNNRTCEICLLSDSSCSDGEWFSALQCKCEACRCMNGGTCDPSSGECMCPPNYYGDLCSEYCSLECQNGGTFIPESCTCSCPLNYTGVECETCTRECQNGGTLVTESCTCVCPEYYTGEECETCITRNCSSGLIFYEDICECDCRPGDTCCPIKCENGGTFVPESCTCMCPPYYYGEYCGIFCSFECQNGGTLIPEDCTCLCPLHYTGEICETCTRECQNGGTFIHENCTCACLPDFTGDMCDEDMSSSSPIILIAVSVVAVVIALGVLVLIVVCTLLAVILVKKKKQKRMDGKEREESPSLYMKNTLYDGIKSGNQPRGVSPNDQVASGIAGQEHCYNTLDHFAGLQIQPQAVEPGMYDRVDHTNSRVKGKQNTAVYSHLEEAPSNPMYSHLEEPPSNPMYEEPPINPMYEEPPINPMYEEPPANPMYSHLEEAPTNNAMYSEVPSNAKLKETVVNPIYSNVEDEPTTNIDELYSQVDMSKKKNKMQAPPPGTQGLFYSDVTASLPCNASPPLSSLCVADDDSVTYSQIDRSKKSKRH